MKHSSACILLSAALVLSGVCVLEALQSRAQAQNQMGSGELRLIHKYQSQVSELDAEEAAANRDLVELNSRQSELIEYNHASKQLLSELLNDVTKHFAEMNLADANKMDADLNGVIAYSQRWIDILESDKAKVNARIGKIKHERQFLYSSLDIERQRLALSTGGSGRKQTFANPMSGDLPLDNCLAQASQCGQAAADAFCVSKHFTKAAAFERTDTRTDLTTRTLDGTFVCPIGFGCGAFTSITCVSNGMSGNDNGGRLTDGAEQESATRDLGSVEPHTQRYGSDYYHLSSDTPAECESACFTDLRCKAWTFDLPSGNYPGKVCWLKNTVPAPVDSSCCVSGVVPQNRPVPKHLQR